MASVSTTAWNCAQEFTEALSNGADSKEELGHQLSRFKIWAGYLGVFTSSTGSLDHRLREEANLSDVLIRLLHKLAKDISKSAGSSSAPEVDEGGQEESNDQASSDSDQFSIDSPSSDEGSHAHPATESQQTHKIKAIDDTITRLFRLSAVIKKPNSSRENAKVESFIERELADHTDDDYAFFVRWKICRDHPGAASYLVERLVESILFRQKRLLYRAKHYEKVEGLESTFKAPTQEPKEPPVHLASSMDPNHRHSNRDPQKSDSFTHPAPVSHTEATSIDQNRLDAYSRSQAASLATQSAIGRRAELDVPRPPKLAKGTDSVACPYCSRLLRNEDLNEPQWTHHVLKDIEPYVCIFEECHDSKLSFAKTQDWLAHMQWEHNLSWRCPAAEQCNQFFHSAVKLEEHLKDSHMGQYTLAQMWVMSEQGGRPHSHLFSSLEPDSRPGVSQESSLCPFCCFTKSQALEQPGPRNTNHSASSALAHKKVEAHIAHHLEALAPLSLPPCHDMSEALSNERVSESSGEGIPKNLDEHSTTTSQDHRQNPNSDADCFFGIHTHRENESPDEYVAHDNYVVRGGTDLSLGASPERPP